MNAFVFVVLWVQQLPPKCVLFSLSRGWLDEFEVGPWHLSPLDSIDFAFVPVAKLPCSFGKHKGRELCLKVMLS